MKTRSLAADGFDKNVAEKMPKMRKLEEPLPLDMEGVSQLVNEDRDETIQETTFPERQEETTVLFRPQKTEAEPAVDILRLIEDLHAQLLVSGRTKRALELDLHSYQKTIQQLARDNQELRSQLENQKKEAQKLREFQSESVYLQEENEDAQERIQKFHQELKEMNEALAKATQEKGEAVTRIQDLESQLEQNELVQIKGKLKEREASHFYEENQKLQLRLEEALSQNLELERKYEALKKSFGEVRESLTLLRDSCKRDYYNLAEVSE